MRQITTIGSVSSGTMLPEDLIPAFMDALDEIKERLSLSVVKGGEMETVTTVGRLDNILGEIEQRMNAADDEDTDYYESEDADYDLETLFNELDEFAPPYCYFGSHEGDGSDYGFWISWESLEEDCRDGDVLKIDAGDEWPEDEIRERVAAGCLDYVLEVNDHGNATLYTVDHIEVWSVV